MKSKKLEYVRGTVSTLHLALAPLKEVGEQIAVDMEVEHTGKQCGVCGRPFNIVRKWQGLARLTYGGDIVVLFSWKLCRKCTREAQKCGNGVPNSLRIEAEKACKELLLAVSDTKGTA